MCHTKFKFNFQQKGVALYLTMVVLSIMSATLLALAVMLANQGRMTGNLSNAVLAFSSADSGIEQALYKIYKENFTSGEFSGSLLNGAAYNVTVVDQSGSIVIHSVGVYRKSKRAIEVSF